MNYETDIRQKFTSLSPQERRTYIQNSSKIEIQALYSMPELFLFDKQIPPPTFWRYHLYMAGRGSGKTFAATSWLYSKILHGAKEVAIMGPDFATLVKEIQPTFESHFPPDKKPKYNGHYHYYRCYNGAIVKCYTSEQEVRGGNIEYGITEEICKWCDGNQAKIEERFDLFDLAVRIGKNPQIFNASTPKNLSWFRKFIQKIDEKDPLYSLSTGTTFDNIYLSEAAKLAYDKKFIGRRRQEEIYAKLLLDVEGALWTSEMLSKAHGITQQFFQSQLNKEELFIERLVIAVDPAVTNKESSDETGIIVAALCSDGHIYILEDASGKYSASEWAKKVIQLYHIYEADVIVAEVNNGGDLIKSNIKTFDQYAKVKEVRATKGKLIRAEPIAALYEEGWVHHIDTDININSFEELEEQLQTFNGQSDVSPDRLDALVWALHELAIDKTYGGLDGLRNVLKY